MDFLISFFVHIAHTVFDIMPKPPYDLALLPKYVMVFLCQQTFVGKRYAAD